MVGKSIVKYLLTADVQMILNEGSMAAIIIKTKVCEMYLNWCELLVVILSFI